MARFIKYEQMLINTVTDQRQKACETEVGRRKKKEGQRNYSHLRASDFRLITYDL
jgi:hypothetical protein